MHALRIDDEDEPRVLVVDDDEDNRSLLLDELEFIGCRGIAVANGEEALAELGRSDIDVVLLDVMMPGMDGFEVLRSLRADPTRRMLPVVMISALSDLVNVVRCIELGADDYLPKPFDPVLLKARISSSMQKKRWRDQEAMYLARMERQLAEIERERARADALLDVVLPTAALRELKMTGAIAPRRYENVAVLFADIVDFTRYTETHPAEEVVANLDRLIVACEWALAQEGLEKIKTIGDGVVATGNLSQRHRDPVMAAVRAGQAMIAAAVENPAGWRMRIGISFGSVIGGVVGRSKFSFDAWGDTVNVAARLSGLGSESAVFLCPDAWSRVAARATAERMDGVALKGKGQMDVYRIGEIRAS
ncbi:adenylate/guanylate cyclase domain-containing protein [Microbaculum marinum]|uniref:Adenylate/guanylate cyclase domain-containing protein n=1 Tax=Microbaculum marinum TaxID=1764581 RepID=A0AAW9RT50_9HYPH